MFKCTYTDAKKNKIETSGRVVSGEDKITYFSVVCESPAFVKAIPFKGVKGRNVMTISMVWTDGTWVGAEYIISVSGLDPKNKYGCTFTDAVNKKITRTQSASFAGSNYKLNCGKVPTGFTIQSEKATSKVFLTVAVSGSSNEVVYAGKATNAVDLPMCLNGAKDGSETDTDCGGACSTKCGPKKKCKVGGDCQGNTCKKGTCGGGPGTSQSNPGESCKQIKRDHNSANGRYWVKGFGGGAMSTAFKVYCWMQERQGGGWTLIQTNWYNGGQASVRPGDYGNVDHPNIFHAKGHAYKLADTKIRAVIGQKSGTPTGFDLMGDQAGINSHYSGYNVEYAIMTNYKANWYSSESANNPIKESSTTTEMKVYTLRSGSRSDPNTPGVGNNKPEGELSWTGRPRCGKWGKSGVNCYGVYGGGNGPNGGRGCKIDRSRGRWYHTLEFFMSTNGKDTYMYLCNGPQHSSGFHMSHRWWIKSTKGSADE